MKLIPVFILVILIGFVLVLTQSACKIYRFTDASVPDSIKTIKINFITNHANYINPRLSPQLTEKLKQKILSQTKLVESKNDTPDWEIIADITQYDISTSGISNQVSANNRLTVGIHLTVKKLKEDKTEEYEILRNIEFSANQSLQEAELNKNTEIINSLTDELFNKLFSNW